MNRAAVSYIPLASRNGNTAFEDEFNWSKSLYPLVVKMVAPFIISEAPLMMDLHEATDLVTENVRMSVRCRRGSQLRPLSKKSRYRTAYTFNIRSKRESGRTTEMQKIMAGKGTHFFYGFVNTSETGFLAWWLINLDVFRSEYAARPELGTNERFPDGTEAKWFDVRQFRGPLCIAGTHLPGHPNNT